MRAHPLQLLAVAAVLCAAAAGTLPFALRKEEQVFCSNEPQFTNTQLAYCSCSPTGGRGSDAARKLLEQRDKEARENFRSLLDAGDGKKARETAENIREIYFEDCFKEYGDVICHDSDASFRVEGEPTSGAYCRYNTKTGENIDLRAADEMTDFGKCEELEGTEGEQVLEVVLAPVCVDGPPSSSGSSSNKSDDPPGGSGSSEGCVDASILPPCRRVHARDILADVLCMRGLCATPSHELVVDGERASAGAICAGGEKCTHARIAVNSCYYRDLEGGRFVHGPSGIAVTSWDVRFPNLATMLVQDGIFAARAVTAFLAGEARLEL